MGHGTRISGTNKAVTAGFTRISGVNKKITKGLTLVGGVQKDIIFAQPPVLVIEAVEGLASNACGVTINGEKIYSTTTLTLDFGTEVSCYAWAPSKYTSATITHDGVVAASSSTANQTVTYTFSVESDIKIALSKTSNGTGIVVITTV